MHISAGSILLSSPFLTDPNFQGSVIFIAEYNQQGAMGFVINKLFERPLNALEEFKRSPAFPLYEGGPVDSEHLYFLHRRPDLVDGGIKITGNIYLGGDFQQALMHINQQTISQNDIKIFIGYCGWDNAELEAEIREGSWLAGDAAQQTVFSHR